MSLPESVKKEKRKRIVLDMRDANMKTVIQELRLVDEAWNNIKEDVYMEAPPYDFIIDSQRFKLTFASKQGEW